MKLKRLTLLIIILIFLISLPAYAENQEPQTLSLNDAINKALLHSTTIKSTQLEIDKNEIQRDHAKQSMLYTPVEYNFNPTDINTFRAFYGADFQYRTAEKKLENDKRQIVIDVTSAYYKVVQSLEMLKTQKITLSKNLLKLGQIKAKYNVGMATNVDVMAAEAQIATDNANIKQYEVTLETNYNELNKILGVDISQRLELTDTVEFTPAEFDKETEVLKALNNSFETWSAEESAKYYEQIKYFEYWSDIGIKQENIAKIQETNTKEQIKLLATALCSKLEALDSQYNQLEQQHKQLEEKLRTVKVSYELGMITRDNVLLMEESLMGIKDGKIKVSLDYINTWQTLKRLTGELPTTISK